MLLKRGSTNISKGHSAILLLLASIMSLGGSLLLFIKALFLSSNELENPYVMLVGFSFLANNAITLLLAVTVSDRGERREESDLKTILAALEKLDERTRLILENVAYPEGRTASNASASNMIADLIRSKAERSGKSEGQPDKPAKIDEAETAKRFIFLNDVTVRQVEEKFKESQEKPKKEGGNK